MTIEKFRQIGRNFADRVAMFMLFRRPSDVSLAGEPEELHKIMHPGETADGSGYQLTEDASGTTNDI